MSEPAVTATKKRINERFIIEQTQNVVSLLMGLAAIKVLNEGSWYWGDAEQFSKFSYAVGMHCAADLVLTRKWDVVLHHVFVLGLLSFRLVHHVQREDDGRMLEMLYATEISSIFLVLNLWLKEWRWSSHSLERSLVMVLFVGTFAYTRIWEYGKLVLDPTLYEDFLKYGVGTHWTRYLHLFGSFYGLFALNVHWFLVMLKVVYKLVVPATWNSDYTARLALQFTYVASLVYATAAYEPFKSEPEALMDWFGILLVTISSFLLHGYVRSLGPKAELNYAVGSLRYWVLVDILTIHVRCVLCVSANMWTSPVTTTRDAMSVILFCVGHHVGAFVVMVHHLFRQKRVDKDTIETLTALLVGLGVMVDTGLIMFGTHSLAHTVELALPPFLMLLASRVRPFYEMNHLFIHGGLFLQTISLVRANGYNLLRRME